MHTVAQWKDRMENSMPKSVSWLFRQELVVLLSLFLIFFGVFGFIQLTDQVLEGDSQHFDEYVVQSLRQPQNPTEPLGPHWMKITAVDLTALGSTAVISLMILAVSGYLALIKKYHAMWYVLAVSIGGIVMSYWMKTWFERERPSVVPHLTEVSTTSFPSAHAMMSAIIYLTLGSLLARFAPGRRLKSYVLMLGVLMTVIIGGTRVYLGVHYPTDVLAGWCAGAVWATLFWVIARYLQRRGAVEKSTGGEEIEEEEVHA